MSSSFNNRLDQLENEIKSLLEMQSLHVKERTSSKSVSSANTASFRPEKEVSVSSSDGLQVIHASKSCDGKKKSKWSKKKRRRKSSVLIDPRCVQVSKRLKMNPLDHKAHYVENCHDSNTLGLDKITDTIIENAQLKQELTETKLLITELNKTNDNEEKLKVHWKEKFIKLKKRQHAFRQDYCNLMQEKEALCRQIEEDNIKLSKSVELQQQLEEQKNLNKVITDNYENLVRVTTKREEQIQKANELLNGHKYMNGQLELQCKELENNLIISKEKYNQLHQTNEELAKNVINNRNALESAIYNAEQYKDLNDEFQNEIKTLKNLCESYKHKNTEATQTVNELTNRIVAQGAELNDYIHCKEIDCKTIVKLENNIDILTNKHVNDLKVSNEKIQLLINENSSLKRNLENIHKKSVYSRENYEDRYKLLLSEFESLKRSKEVKENQMYTERNELCLVLEELTCIIKKQKTRHIDLMSLNREQEETIKRQQCQLSGKSEELEGALKDVKALKSDCNDLKENSKAMRDSFEKYNSSEYSISISLLKEENGCLRHMLDEAGTNIDIKDKMLADHVNTIMEIKKKAEEKNTLLVELNTAINTERQKKAEIQGTLKDIENEKNDAVRKCEYAKSEIRNLQNAMDNLKQSLQKQVEEWKVHSQMCNTEKQQALHAAKFATEKLEQTMQDFNRQTKLHKHVRDTLTEMLKEKHSQLKSSIIQMGHLTVSPGINMYPRYSTGTFDKHSSRETLTSESELFDKQSKSCCCLFTKRNSIFQPQRSSSCFNNLNYGMDNEY